MKKTIGIAVGLLFSMVIVQAQDYVALDRFMRKYCQNWKTGYQERTASEDFKMVVQLGQPMPEFHFNWKAMLVSLVTFLLAYELILYVYSGKIERQSVKSIMLE